VADFCLFANVGISGSSTKWRCPLHALVRILAIVECIPHCGLNFTKRPKCIVHHPSFIALFHYFAPNWPRLKSITIILISHQYTGGSYYNVPNAIGQHQGTYKCPLSISHYSFQITFQSFANVGISGSSAKRRCPLHALVRTIDYSYANLILQHDNLGNNRLQSHLLAYQASYIFDQYTGLN